MQGINFSYQNDIDTNFALNGGDSVIQWKLKSMPKGDYYSKRPNKPCCLGIHCEQQDIITGDIGKRIEHTFIVQRKVICLKSRASNVLDTWSIKNRKINVTGGGIQYFNVLDRKEFRGQYRKI